MVSAGDFGVIADAFEDICHAATWKTRIPIDGVRKLITAHLLCVLMTSFTQVDTSMEEGSSNDLARDAMVADVM